MTPNDLYICSRSKIPTCMTYIHSQGPNFRSFCSMMSHFELRTNFRKVLRITPNKLNWYVQGQKYQQACYIHTRGPNFRSFHSMMSRFWITAQFSEKCTNWPWHVQDQRYTYAYDMHLFFMRFFSVSLYDYTPHFRRAHLITQIVLTCSRPKIPIWML